MHQGTQEAGTCTTQTRPRFNPINDKCSVPQAGATRHPHQGPSPHERHKQRYPLRTAWQTARGWILEVRDWCAPPVRYFVETRSELMDMMARGAV